MYGLFVVASVGLAIMVLILVRPWFSRGRGAASPAEVALATRGEVAAVGAALAYLIAAKAVEIEKDTYVAVVDALPGDAGPLETALYNAIERTGGRRRIALLARATGMRPAITRMRKDLRRRGYLEADGYPRLRRLAWLLLVPALLAGVGAVFAGAGPAEVGELLGCAVAAAVIAYVGRRLRFRAPAALRAARRLRRGLTNDAAQDWTMLPPTAAASRVALFGPQSFGPGAPGLVAVGTWTPAFGLTSYTIGGHSTGGGHGFLGGGDSGGSCGGGGHSCGGGGGCGGGGQ